MKLVNKMELLRKPEFWLILTSVSDSSEGLKHERQQRRSASEPS